MRSRYIPLVGWFSAKKIISYNQPFGLVRIITQKQAVHVAGIESVETAKEKLGNALLAAKAGELLSSAGGNPPDAMPLEASSVPSMALREADAFRRRCGRVVTPIKMMGFTQLDLGK